MTKSFMDKELKQWQDTNCVSEEGRHPCFWADYKALKIGDPCCTKCAPLRMDGMGNCLSFETREEND